MVVNVVLERGKEIVMTNDEVFAEKREAFRKWLEQFSADDCVKLLGDVHDAIEYKRTVEVHLKGAHAN